MKIEEIEIGTEVEVCGPQGRESALFGGRTKKFTVIDILNVLGKGEILLQREIQNPWSGELDIEEITVTVEEIL